MTENELLNRFPSNAENNIFEKLQATNTQSTNPLFLEQQTRAVQNVDTTDYSSQVKNIALRDLAIVENLAKAGILNPTQGQHLANYILNKAKEVLVNQKPNPQTALPPQNISSGIDEFVKEQPNFFKDNARAEVLNYIKNSNSDINKDGILQISQLVEKLEKSAIEKYLQQQAHEKSLNDENEAAKQRLQANAQNQMFTDDNSRIFTREQIGKMSGAEFAKNEKAIMEQAKKGLIR